MKVEREVEIAWLIVISTLRVEDVPGVLADKSLRILTASS